MAADSRGTRSSVPLIVSAVPSSPVPPMPSEPRARGASELADAAQLRATIAKELAATPVDEEALRRDVWTYVGTERHAGASPGQVIMALTDLVGGGSGAAPLQQARLRRVILWCVEAYFGHLGGDVVGREDDAFADVPRRVSTR